DTVGIRASEVVEFVIPGCLRGPSGHRIDNLIDPRKLDPQLDWRDSAGGVDPMRVPNSIQYLKREGRLSSPRCSLNEQDVSWNFEKLQEHVHHRGRCRTDYRRFESLRIWFRPRGYQIISSWIERQRERFQEFVSFAVFGQEPMWLLCRVDSPLITNETQEPGVFSRRRIRTLWYKRDSIGKWKIKERKSRI